MIKVYVKYPNSHVTLHYNPKCIEVQKMKKSGQRYVRINTSTISAELQRFQNKGYSFAAQPAANDMWIEIDFSDPDFEKAVLEYVLRLLCKHYSLFAKAFVTIHC